MILNQIIKCHMFKLCNIKLIFFLLLSPLFISADIPNDSHGEKTLPIINPEYNWELIRNKVSPELTKRLEEHLTQNKYWKKLIEKRRFAIGIVDLSDIWDFILL